MPNRWRCELYTFLKNKLEISHGENAPMLSMEGLRGVAVFLVFWVHYSTLSHPWLSGFSVGLSDFIYSFGNVGVFLFFMLSGYLIYGAIIDKSTFSIVQYGKRRVHRIYPTFLVVFAAYVVLSFLFPDESKLPSGVWERTIYIIQNMLLMPGIFDIQPIMTVAWSLSYEVFYYLLIPTVIFSLKLKSWKVDHRIWFWVLITALSLIAYRVLDGPIDLIMFISGILLFEIYAKKQFVLSKGGTRFLLLALAIFGLRSVFQFSWALSILSIFILFLLLGLCAFNQQSKAYNWLSYTLLRWLGNMSYSYYLLHGLTLKVCFLLLGFVLPENFASATVYYWLWVPLFICTLVTSFILFLIVERPISLQVSSRQNSAGRPLVMTS